MCVYTHTYSWRQDADPTLVSLVLQMCSYISLYWQGDEVEEYQPLCEVQSDKASIEITSRYKGKVVQFLHAPGDIVKVTLILLNMYE